MTEDNRATPLRERWRARVAFYQPFVEMLDILEELDCPPPDDVGVGHATWGRIMQGGSEFSRDNAEVASITCSQAHRPTCQVWFSVKGVHRTERPGFEETDVPGFYGRPETPADMREVATMFVDRLKRRLAWNADAVQAAKERVAAKMREALDNNVVGVPVHETPSGRMSTADTRSNDPKLGYGRVEAPLMTCDAVIRYESGCFTAHVPRRGDKDPRAGRLQLSAIEAELRQVANCADLKLRAWQCTEEGSSWVVWLPKLNISVQAMDRLVKVYVDPYRKRGDA